jgi:signal transduction histidine kinase
MPSGASSSAEGPSTDQSFAEHCIAVNAARLRVVIRIAVPLVLVAGPVEYLLLSGRPEAAAWQASWMVGVLVAVAAGALAFRRIRWLRRRPDLVVLTVGVLGMGIAAAGTSRIGGLETLYAGMAILTPMIGLLFLMPLRRRVWVSLATPAVYFAVTFALRPEALAHPYVAVPLFHATLSVGLSIVFGELIYRLAREHHAQRSRLAGEAARLDSTVRARTAEVLELARNLVSLEETERTRIARELHDELGQELTGARLEAGAVAAEARDAMGSDAPLARRATGIEARIALTQQRVRDVVFSLRPPALDDFDLTTALLLLVERYRHPNRLVVDYDDALDGTRLTDTQATTVFRVLQEALTNVTRHAAARRAHVRLAHEGGRVVVVVADDGRGMDTGNRAGFGLRGMRERLRLVGGDLTVEPGPDGGTVLRATFPVGFGSPS